MFKRKSSPTVDAVRADATRAAHGKQTTPEDHQAAAADRALMHEASNDERRRHAKARVQMSETGPGAPDPS